MAQKTRQIVASFLDLFSSIFFPLLYKYIHIYVLEESVFIYFPDLLFVSTNSKRIWPTPYQCFLNPQASSLVGSFYVGNCHYVLTQDIGNGRQFLNYLV